MKMTTRFMRPEDLGAVLGLAGRTIGEADIRRAARGEGNGRAVVSASGGAVQGAAVFELRPHGYYARLFAGTEAARAELLAHLESRATRSPERKSLSLSVADGEWEALRALMDAGFKQRRVDGKGGPDTWLLVRP